jgi:hypothetical protein
MQMGFAICNIPVSSEMEIWRLFNFIASVEH